jgi:hypothetical protein
MREDDFNLDDYKPEPVSLPQMTAAIGLMLWLVIAGCLIDAKLEQVIDVAWIWVMAPIWIPALLICCLLAAISIVMAWADHELIDPYDDL